MMDPITPKLIFFSQNTFTLMNSIIVSTVDTRQQLLEDLNAYWNYNTCRPNKIHHINPGTLTFLSSCVWKSEPGCYALFSYPDGWWRYCWIEISFCQYLTCLVSFPWFTYLDVDECALHPDICPAGRRCWNTHGSYTCLCPPGQSYQWINDRLQCAGKTYHRWGRHSIFGTDTILHWQFNRIRTVQKCDEKSFKKVRKRL